MIHIISPTALAELRNLITSSTAAQQRVIDFGRACALMLGLDADNPALKFDARSGTFEVPDSPATPLSSDDAPSVPVAT